MAEYVREYELLLAYAGDKPCVRGVNAMPLAPDAVPVHCAHGTE